MATGDQQNMFDRLVGLLPAGWFGDSNPVRDALLGGYAQALAWAYTLYLYAKAQTRIKTATDGWLDLIALDFFGNNLLRNSNQADSSFRNRILINIFRERTTRHAIEQVLFDLTGRMPKIVEPARPADVGAYGAAVAVSQPGTTTMIDNSMLVFVPPNTPRYQNGALLLEESRTNLVQQSGNGLAGGGYWASTFPGSISSAGQSWSGMNGTRIASGGSSWNGIRPASSAAWAFDVGTYCATFFYKAGTSGQYLARLRDNTNNLEWGFFGAVGTQTPSLSTAAGGAATFIDDVLIDPVNGVRRLRFSVAITTAVAVGNLTFGPNTSTVGNDVIFFGAQVEKGAFPSSYIPTYGAQVTRVADTLLNNMPTGSASLGGYGAAGAYGSLVHPYQAFITAYRPSGQGLPYVAGYTIPTGAYSTPSRAVYAQLSPGDVTDADIYAAIDATKPYGSVAWVQIQS